MAAIGKGMKYRAQCSRELDLQCPHGMSWKGFKQCNLKNSRRHPSVQQIAAQGERNSEDFEEFEDSEYEFIQSGGRTRLATRVITIPRRVDLYFAGNLFRQSFWSIIAFCAGYYAANVVSLSFGALAINDVLAAILTVVFCEFCSKLFYSAPRKTLRLIFLNAFKLGVIAALIADALKLQG